MNLPDRPAIRAAYANAVVTLLNVTYDTTEEDCEAFVDAMADLIFTTMQTYINEEESHDSTHNH